MILFYIHFMRYNFFSISLNTYSHYLEHTAPIFRSLELLNVYQTFKLNCLLLVHKCTQNNYFLEFKRKLQKSSSIHSYKTRNNNLLRPPLEKLKRCQKSYLYVSIILWNTINDDIRNINTIITFKETVKSLIIGNKI